MPPSLVFDPKVSAMSSSVFLGIDDYKFNKEKIMQPVYWPLDQALSGHAIIIGGTGSGKTTQLRSMAAQLKQCTKAQIHIMDIHGDIRVPDESVVMLSESTPFGLNPLELFDDPHYGGVRKRIQSFVHTLNSVSLQLGPKQESTLRALLEDLYEINGFKTDDPTSWGEEVSENRLDPTDERIFLDIPFDQKDLAKTLASKFKVKLEFDGTLKCWFVDNYHNEFSRWPIKRFGKTYPTLDDLIRFANMKMRQIFMGSSNKAMLALDELNRDQAKLNSIKRRLNSGAAVRLSQEEIQKLEDGIEKQKTKVIESFSAHVNNISTGYELDSHLRYSGYETIKSLIDRLTNIRGTGIFKSVPPRFAPGSRVHRFNLSPLQIRDTQRLFVDTYLRQLFERCVAMGETDELRHIVILDEAEIYADGGEESMLNILANQARKFGIGLILASQSPKHFSEDLMAAASLKMLLGVDTLFWKDIISKMRVTPAVLEYISPTKKIAVQVKLRGQLRSQFKQVNISADVLERFKRGAGNEVPA